eukprot:scaffold6166_cov350-Prasinococcus_capsulatus_cf.AAC.1
MQRSMPAATGTTSQVRTPVDWTTGAVPACAFVQARHQPVKEGRRRAGGATRLDRQRRFRP